MSTPACAAGPRHPAHLPGSIGGAWSANLDVANFGSGTCGGRDTSDEAYDFTMAAWSAGPGRYRSDRAPYSCRAARACSASAARRPACRGCSIARPQTVRHRSAGRSWHRLDRSRWPGIASAQTWSCPLESDRRSRQVKSGYRTVQTGADWSRPGQMRPMSHIVVGRSSAYSGPGREPRKKTDRPNAKEEIADGSLLLPSIPSEWSPDRCAIAGDAHSAVGSRSALRPTVQAAEARASAARNGERPRPTRRTRPWPVSRRTPPGGAPVTAAAA
jgi:hypothetical protein